MTRVKEKQLFVDYDGEVIKVKWIRGDQKMKCDVIVLDNNDGTIIPIKDANNYNLREIPSA